MEMSLRFRTGRWISLSRMVTCSVKMPVAVEESIVESDNPRMVLVRHCLMVAGNSLQ